TRTARVSVQLDERRGIPLHTFPFPGNRLQPATVLLFHNRMTDIEVPEHPVQRPPHIDHSLVMSHSPVADLAVSHGPMSRGWLGGVHPRGWPRRGTRTGRGTGTGRRTGSRRR